uniref:Uncharacterized protein n=1 Tax=Anguilla anguilla TaxID=7936 RepID=A0A0E9WVD0_ANGAN
MFIFERKKYIYNKLKRKRLYVASSGAWLLVWRGGQDLLTQPSTKEKGNSEVDNWSVRQPGQKHSLLEDNLIYKAIFKKISTVIQNNKGLITVLFPVTQCKNLIITVLNHFIVSNSLLSCFFFCCFVFFTYCIFLFFVVMKSVCGTCWIQIFLHACVCVCPYINRTRKKQCKCTKKAHSPNCNLIWQKISYINCTH